MGADLILKNGKVFSVTLDDKVIRGSAVAVSDGIITKIGTDEEVLSLADNNCKIIDCGGNTILPGLSDVHCHPSIAASAADACNLFGIYKADDESPEDVIEKYKKILSDYVKANPDKKIIRGTGWVLGNFSGTGIMPKRQDIDEVCPDIPVVLESFCQHNLWVNTKAIEAAGVDENTPDVKAGKIYREENGYPAGVFNDPEAMAYIKEGVPGYELSVDEYKKALEWYQKECAAKYGVTLVQDCMHSDSAREAYRQLAEEHKLIMRARGVYLIEPDKYESQFEKAVERKGKDNCSEDFRIDTIKIFAEGMFSLLEPYEDEYCRASGIPEGSATDLYWSDEVMTKYSKKAMDAGFDVHIHAMGDASVKQCADCLSEAQEEERDNRNVIAHLMLVPDETSEKMGKSRIIGNVQMRWMVYDGDIYAMHPIMGEERSGKAYPMRKMLDDGVILSAGTDFPVTPPPNVMHEIQCALTRKVFPDVNDYDKYKGRRLGDEKPVTLEEVIKALTINSAYQVRAEEYTGSIEEGKSADLVILDRDLENTPVDEIYSIEVEKTIFKGEVVYDK